MHAEYLVLVLYISVFFTNKTIYSKGKTQIKVYHWSTHKNKTSL